MQKIILDTNVIVSALISNAVPTNILYDVVFRQLVKSCLSVDVFEEYIEVMFQIGQTAIFKSTRAVRPMDNIVFLRFLLAC